MVTWERSEGRAGTKVWSWLDCNGGSENKVGDGGVGVLYCLDFPSNQI
jgi:hypothetical protein